MAPPLPAAVQARTGARGEARTVLRYLLAGGAAAAANYGSRFGFSGWLPFEAAVVLAAGVGTAVAFVLMRRYVFAPGGQALRTQMLSFAAVSVASALQTLLVSSLIVRGLAPALGWTQGVEAVAHALGVGFPALTSYLLHRRITFR
jgi:putative flippase GtrA